MSQIELFSQAGMEAACRDFVRYMHEDRPYAVNALLDPTFVSCDFEKKELLIRIPMQAWMENPSGVMHGGVTSAMLDVAMGSHTFYWAGKTITPTISMSVNYLRPIPQGHNVIARSVVTSCGRTMAYARAEAWLEDVPEKIVATAQGVYHISRA